MRRLLSSLLAVGLLLMLSACGAPASSSSSSASSEASSQTEEASPVTTPFTLPVFPEFSLHPTLGANRANLTLSPLLYEGLFLVDERFQAVPVLCERYSFSEDKRVWTFTLRSGMTLEVFCQEPNGDAQNCNGVSISTSRLFFSMSGYTLARMPTLSMPSG